MTENKNHLGCVNLVPIFNHLDKESQDKCASKAYSKKIKRNEYLYQAGDLDDSLYIVHQGQVRITYLAESGKEQLIRLLNPGDFTGEWTIFSEESYHENYAQATRETSICAISKQNFDELLTEYPKISRKILKIMANRLQESQKQTSSISTEDVRNRIIYYLENLTNSGFEDETTLELPMSRKDLASYLGTTAETISRKFKELEEEGLIRPLVKNKLHIPSVEKLLFATD